MDAQQWLTAVFSPSLERESLAYTNDADLLRGQLAALHDCELIDDEAHTEAQRRLDAAVQAARQRARLDIRPPDLADPAPPPAIALVRVLAVAQPLATVDGMPFVLTSAELWSNGVDLFLAGLPTVESARHIHQHEVDLNRWARERRAGRSGEGTLSAPQLRGNRLFDLDIRLRDDIGTSYRGMGGSAGGSRTEWRMHRHFEPGPPGSATRFTVEIADDDGHVIGSVEIPA